jgi:hypothetical protein
LFYCLKNYAELLVILYFHIINFLLQIFVSCYHFTQPAEGPHDLNVNLKGSFAVQDTGKHGHTLFCKGH